MDVDNPVSIAIDIIVIISTGISFQFIKILCRNKAYPILATKPFGLRNEKLIWHFSKQLWHVTWHLFCFLFLLSVIIPSNFWISTINPYNKQYGTSLLWSYESNEKPSIGIHAIYLIAIGHYTFDIFYIGIFDKTNDVLTMCVHHLASLSLLWMSYLPPPTWKIGCTILLIHDIGDVTLYTCKVLHYAQFEITSNVLFIFHLLIWIWSRLIWFPRYIASLFLDIEDRSKVWQVWPCSILLCTLLVLHIYWTYLMVKVLYKAVIKKEAIADPRDKNNPMMGREIGQDVEAMLDDNGDKVNLDDMEPLKINDDRTDNLDDAETPRPPSMRRRSSLMGSFIESKEKIITPSNEADNS